ncbi:MAG TPA: hypothetical protein VF625_08495, partial [Longimicrobium sp.]
PALFQLRVELQALSNALERSTSDRLKLLRMTSKALGTTLSSELGGAALLSRLRKLHTALDADLPVDRRETAGSLRHLAATLARAGETVPPRAAAAMAR